LALLNNVSLQVGTLAVLSLWLAVVMWQQIWSTPDRDVHLRDWIIIVDCVVLVISSLVYRLDNGRTRLLRLGVVSVLALLGLGLVSPYIFGGWQIRLGLTARSPEVALAVLDAWQILLSPLLNYFTFGP
jgi:hypothetical protein